jgi:hypothetical protein
MNSRGRYLRLKTLALSPLVAVQIEKIEVVNLQFNFRHSPGGVSIGLPALE